MKKIILVLLILTTISLLLTPYAFAGARKGKAGYAVRDDNAMTEIRAIKLEMQAMEREIKFLKENQTKPMSPIELGKIEGRLTWAENQINKLWKWITALSITLLIIGIALIAVYILGGKVSRRTQ